MGVQSQVSDLNFLSLDTHVIFMSITCALMALFGLFSTVEKRYRRFRSEGCEKILPVSGSFYCVVVRVKCEAEWNTIIILL